MMPEQSDQFKRIKTGLLTLLLACTLISCEKEQLVKTQDCSEARPADHPKAEALEGVLRTYTNQGLPGISLLIRDSTGLWTGAAGMAYIKRDFPMKPCHISKVASITKPFIAALVMMLVEEGRISLDAQITQYVDNDLSNIANAGQATVQQLLNHTSGVYDVISDDQFYLAVLNEPTRE